MGSNKAVMISTGSFIERVVHTTRKHPQIGTIWYEGKRRKVYISFYLDAPVWTLVEDSTDEQEYEYCAQKTMPIEDDPDDCGEDGQEAGAAVPRDGNPVVIIGPMVRTEVGVP